VTICEKKSLHCQFAAELGELAAVRSFVKFSCDALEMHKETFINDVQLAVHEAFMNIILHGANEDGTPIIVECERQKEGLSLRLFDQGATHFAPKPTPLPPDESEKGRGLAIIFSLVDKVEFTQKSNMCEWNKLHLFKKYLPS
jgi:anti-sigma regulatory factor (Ser/Thr protein kinase)